MEKKTMNEDENVLGYCPICSAPAKSCARNPIGPTICIHGHEYPHNQRVYHTKKVYNELKKEQYRIFVDMDGVIADFEAGANKLGMECKEFKLRYGAYLNLPVMNGAINAIKSLIDAGHDVWIATKLPTHNPYSATEKLLWIEKYFPELVGKVIITPDKGCLKADYLIDDRPHKAHCDNFSGTFIHFGSTDFADWSLVLKYFDS